MHAIFYTHQTSGTCAGVCMCNCKHQMDKTEGAALIEWFRTSDELINNIILQNIRKQREK